MAVNHIHLKEKQLPVIFGETVFLKNSREKIEVLDEQAAILTVKLPCQKIMNTELRGVLARRVALAYLIPICRMPVIFQPNKIGS